MKQRTLNILDNLLNDIDSSDIIENSDNYFATMIRPKKLTGKMTDEMIYDQEFEQRCLILGKFINQPVKTLTTKEYFTLIGYYNAQNKR